MYTGKVLDVSEKCGSRFSGRKACKIPKYVWFKKTINETTRALCKQLCALKYEKDCSGFYYDTEYRSCVLVSFTGGEGDCEVLPGLEFYKRHRCVGKYRIMANILH